MSEPDWHSTSRSASLGPTLALTVTLLTAVFLALMALVMSVAHPTHNFALLGNLVNQQNQSAKTALYLVAFLVLLPLSLLFGPRLADRIASGPNGSSLTTLTALLTATLAATIIVVRCSGSLPWGNGLTAVLGGIGGWLALAGGALAKSAGRRVWTPLQRATRAEHAISILAGALVFGALLGVTDISSISASAMVLGAALAAAVMVLRDRLHPPSLPVWAGRTLDLSIIAVVCLAIPDVVIFHPSPVPPNLFVEPGIVQSQHDFFLGATNQLLAGGTLLVNAPGSQYGVGSLYFLAGWFHLVPIGYGTFGLLDGILTALFYAAGYSLLRIAGTTRLWAGAAIALGVIAFVYHFQYSVGVLPEQGPLRFGLPMVALLGAVLAARSPRFRRIARIAAFAALGISAVWAVEAFGFTVITLTAVVATEAWLRPGGQRRGWLARQAALAVAACVVAHAVFAVATLAGSGHLPDWGQYFAYVQSFLLGGKAGQVTYGFPPWSPALAFGAAALASAAAVILLARREPGVARSQPAVLIALSGTTAYGVAMLSYVDNRSSTYLLPYIALPTLIASTLWLNLLLRAAGQHARRTGAAVMAFALAVSVLLVATAWSGVGAHFSRSALAHAYPGGGITAAVHRLEHPPPIDPRTPAGERLISRFIPGRRALVLLPAAPDLATEILMHSGRGNLLSIGDPGMDSYVPQNWTTIIGREIAALQPGTRVLIDPAVLTVESILREHPALNPLEHPLILGGTQPEWIVQQLDRRFRLKVIHRDPDQELVLAELVNR